MLPSKNKVADEKKQVQNVKFKSFKDMKLSLPMVKFFKNAFQCKGDHQFDIFTPQKWGHSTVFEIDS